MLSNETRQLALECDDLSDDGLLVVLAKGILLRSGQTTREIMGAISKAPIVRTPAQLSAAAAALSAYRKGTLDVRANLLPFVRTPIAYWNLNEESGNLQSPIGGWSLARVNSLASAAGKYGTKAIAPVLATPTYAAGTGPSVEGYPAFTFAAWIYTTEAAAVQTIMGRAPLAGGRAVRLFVATSQQEVRITINTTSIVAVTPGPIANDWHLAAGGRRANGNGFLYWDGLPMFENALPVCLSMDAPFCIGATEITFPTVQFPFSGYIDDARVWNVDLSDEEMATLYAYSPI